MKPTRAIAVFVKTPGLSPVKTRLAAGIGEDRALEFYNLALDCVTELVGSVDAIPYWAVAESNSSFPAFRGFEMLWTGEGGLGERQHHIYSTLLKDYDQVMLLGTDAPQLTPALLEEAFDKLEEHDFVFGPSHDGGYNFFAGKKEIPLDIWSSVEYSKTDTLENLCSNLSGFYMIQPSLGDVDTLPDLSVMLDEMPETPTKEKQKIIEWTKKALVNHAA